MNAIWMFRAALFARGCCLVLGWLFDWGSHCRAAAVTSPHFYVEFFADAMAVAVLLALLTGLWLFRRWARLSFVLLLGLVLVYSAIEPRQSTSSSPSPTFVFAVTGFMVMLNGVIVAMSFLSPVRHRFADET